MKTIITKIPNRKAFLKGEGSLEIGYPWLSFGAIIFLEAIVNKNTKVLEFGSGGSTVFWAKNCLSVKSYESNPEWLEKVKNRVKKFDNVQINLADERKTLRAISNELDNCYDIVLVDSYPGDIKRILVANAVLPKIKPGGYLIIDNYLKFGMENFEYPKSEIFTFDELRYSGRGTRICKLENKKTAEITSKKMDLSILIPARNEMFLAKTIENILENIEGNTEIIAVMDGYWADPPVPQHERVTVIHHKESIGQRAATNEAARLSKAKYLMKVDAHCSFDKGFDVKMMGEMHDDWTMVPLMKNLHAFDWVCPDGHRRYQGPSGPCKECKKETKRDILWHAKKSPNSVSYCFDSTPHFQYFGDYAKRPEGQGDITETMSLQGSCWMLTRDKYWELNVCDEAFGSWGSQGIEVAVKTWLSGGKVMVNKKTWYGHMFRTQGGDFGFPYPISRSDQEKAKSSAKDLFFNNKWDKQIRPLSWLVEKFWPVKGWTDEDLKKLKSNTFEFSKDTSTQKPAESEPIVETPTTKEIPQTSKTVSSISGDVYNTESMTNKPTKGIIFYTDNQLQLNIARGVQAQLRKIESERGIPIVSASLKPMDFGKNIHVPLTRGVLTMFKQILVALEASETDIVYFCEADVFYHPSHFDFTPPKKDVYYFNENVWKLDAKTGHALHYECKQVSGISVYRKLAVEHYRKRVAMVEKDGFSMKMGYEPGTHGRPERVDDATCKGYMSEFPIVDIRHGANFSPTRWKKEQFRNQKFTKGWTESDTEIPGWGLTAEFVKKFN